MKQQISAITLGVEDLERSKRFYIDGFGWAPIYQNEDICFYQMNGLILGTWRRAELAADMKRPQPPGAGSFSLAHNVGSAAHVDDLLARLAAAGGQVLRPGDAPVHGGYRGYVADPDDHAWEIAWNPAWTISRRGSVTFGP